MTAPRPTGYPEWASAATNIAEPLASEKASGWGINQAPPSSYFNYLQQQYDNWVRYFDRWTYSPIVRDDFARGAAYFGVGSTNAFGPVWDISSSSDVSIQEDLSNGAAGVAQINRTASGIAYLKSYAQAVADLDYRMEIIAKTQARGSSGSSIEVGALGFLSFIATGASSTWGLSFTPTGAGSPTQINLGVDPYSPTSYQTFVAERRGATLLVEINGNQVAALPGKGFTYADAGVKVTRIGSNVTVLIDKIEFGVRR